MKLAAAIVVLAACANPERQVEGELAAYRRAVFAMNVPAIVDEFAPSASISHADQPPVIGKDAIGAFLQTFAAFHVTEYTLVADSTRVDGELAFQHGHYHQAVTTPDGKAVEVSGVFDADWKQQPDGHWRITRMHTAPK
jgi:uncharacterized protein (TIGR02246 family)